MFRMFSIVSSKPRRRAEAMGCGGSLRINSLNTKPRCGSCQLESAGSSVILIGWDALFTTRVMSFIGRFWRYANVLTQPCPCSSNSMVVGRGGSGALPPAGSVDGIGIGVTVMALITSPGLRPALAAGESARTATIWGRIGRHNPSPETSRPSS